MSAKETLPTVDTLVDASIRALHEQLTEQNKALRTRLDAAEEERDGWHKKADAFYENLKLANEDCFKLEKANAELVKDKERLKNLCVNVHNLAGAYRRYEPSRTICKMFEQSELIDAAIVSDRTEHPPDCDCSLCDFL